MDEGTQASSMTIELTAPSEPASSYEGMPFPICIVYIGGTWNGTLRAALHTL